VRYKAYVSLGTESGIADAAVRAASGRPMSPAAEKLAARHARAMKAVLLAAKAWNRARESRRMMPDGLSAEYVTRCRLACACQRLAKIEKEVSRG